MSNLCIYKLTLYPLGSTRMLLDYFGSISFPCPELENPLMYYCKYKNPKNNHLCFKNIHKCNVYVKYHGKDFLHDYSHLMRQIRFDHKVLKLKMQWKFKLLSLWGKILNNNQLHNQLKKAISSLTFDRYIPLNTK